MGLIGRSTFTVTVEPWFVMIDTNLVLSQRLVFNEVIVTNGGVLTAPLGMECGRLRLSASTISLGTNSTTTDAMLMHSRLFGTNGVVFDGDVTLKGTNYIQAAGVFGSTALDVAGTNVMVGNFSIGNLAINDLSRLTFSGTNTADSILVGSNGVLTTLPKVPLVLAVAGEARVEAGGVLDARDKGYQGGAKRGGAGSQQRDWGQPWGPGRRSARRPCIEADVWRSV